MYKFISGILAVLIVIGTILTVKHVNVFGVNTGLVLLALVIAYIIFSIGIVDADEVGLLKFFGQPVKHLNPGLYIAPVGLFSIDKERGTEFQDELPADPEHIFRQEDVETIPEGMFPPIRVKFGSPRKRDLENPALKDDPYNYAMVVEVTPVVSWRISDMVAFRQRFGDPENCRRILTDKCVAIFGDEFARMTPAKATLRLRKTSQKIEDFLVDEIGDGWGIEITDAYIKPLQFSHSLNSAVVDVKTAEQEAKAEKHRGEGERDKRTARATGIRAEVEAWGSHPVGGTIAMAESIESLKDLKGTLVLGGGTTPVIDVNKKGETT